MNTPVNTPAFIERENRIQDAIALRQPDRVPIALSCIFWTARYAGMTCAQAMYDYDGLTNAVRQALQEFQPDFYKLPHPEVALGPTLEKMDYWQLKWPGQEGIDPDVSYQYLDKEYMTGPEYDEYIFDPTGFYLRKYLPRVAGAYKGFATLPPLPSSIYFGLAHDTGFFAEPPMQESLQKIVDAGQEILKMRLTMIEAAMEFTEMGFPLAEGSVCGAPFDYFADFFRGAKGAMLDMFRRPDKLLEAMDVATHFITERVIADTKHAPTNRVFIPLHWGLGGFMSPKQFNTFYWPQLRKVLIKLIDNGLTPCVLWEGDCTERLETIKDIPEAKCIYHFEQTDMVKAKEVLGDVVCIRGSIPGSAFVMGTPDDVREHCKKLIDVCGKGGGFIMDGSVSAGIPDNAKPENVKAMFDFTRDYGIYG